MKRMNYSRALEYIEARLGEIVVESQLFKDRTQKHLLEEEIEFLGVARMAIGKQIPLPPKKKYDEASGSAPVLRCPICNGILPDSRSVCGCAFCLQSIDFHGHKTR